MNIRELLSQEPLSFNELLDLFESYVSTVSAPLFKGHDMLREEIGAGEHEALGEIFGVACDANLLAKRLCQIRAARNSGSDVTITMTRHEALILGMALEEMDRVSSAVISAIEMLHARAEADTENEDAGSRAILALALRAMAVSDEQDGAKLRLFSRKLRETGAFQPFDREEAA